MRTRIWFEKVQLIMRKTVLYLPTFLLCCLWSISPAFGQTSAYSDSWFDGSSSQSYMVGSGVTEESYMGYGHDTWVNTTITSPNGSTASGGGGGGSYSWSEVSIAINLDDPEIGEFLTESSHGYYCPIAAREYDLGLTFDLIGFGFSQACYIYQYTIVGLDRYDIASGCFAKPVSCPGSGTVDTPAILNYPNNILRWEFFLYEPGAPNNRHCVNKVVLVPAPNGCTSTACRDFPALN